MAKTERKNPSHLGRLPEGEMKKSLTEFLSHHKNAIEKFIEAIVIGLMGLDKNWRDRPALEQQRRFNKVFDFAKEQVVKKDEGGKNDTDQAIALTTFRSYKTMAKKSLVYRVNWQIAKSTNTNALKIARNMVNGDDANFNRTQNQAMTKYTQLIEKAGETDLTREDKMEYAVNALKEASPGSGKDEEKKRPRGRGLETPWTLPDPDTYDNGGVLTESAKIVVDYWQQDDLKGHVEADSRLSRAIRHALTELKAALAKPSEEAA